MNDEKEISTCEETNRPAIRFETAEKLSGLWPHEFAGPGNGP